jgi:hypothetical protein
MASPFGIACSGWSLMQPQVSGYYIFGVSNGVSPASRRSFITERRRAAVYRFDTLHSPDHDENWGAISPSHAAFATGLTTLVRGINLVHRPVACR